MRNAGSPLASAPLPFQRRLLPLFLAILVATLACVAGMPPGRDWVAAWHNAMIALLAFAAFWPLAHRGLVARFGTDPWKLGGFAMYTTPSLPVLLAFLVPREGRLAPLDEAELPPDARAVLERFRAERLALGQLREPDDAARAVLDARPDLPAVVLVVQHTVLEPRTARTRASSERYSYDRSMLAD